MTLIIGALTDDYVAIVGDGNATNMDNQLLKKTDFPKVLSIDRKLYFGVASSGFSLMDLIYLTDGVRQVVDFTPPFTVHEKAVEFGNFARNLFSNRPHVATDFIFGGFDCESDGTFSTPRLFFISSDNNYKPFSASGRQVYYAPNSCPDVLANTELVNDKDHLSGVLFGALKIISDKHPLIGGLGTGVLLSREGNLGLRYDLDKSENDKV